MSKKENYNAEETAKEIARLGKGGDTKLVHMTREELAQVSQVFGRKPGINPSTGLPSFSPLDDATVGNDPTLPAGGANDIIGKLMSGIKLGGSKSSGTQTAAQKDSSSAKSLTDASLAEADPMQQIQQLALASLQQNQFFQPPTPFMQPNKIPGQPSTPDLMNGKTSVDFQGSPQSTMKASGNKNSMGFSATVGDKILVDAKNLAHPFLAILQGGE